MDNLDEIIRYFRDYWPSDHALNRQLAKYIWAFTGKEPNGYEIRSILNHYGFEQMGTRRYGKNVYRYFKLR